MTTLREAAALAADDHGLAVVTTLRSDFTLQSTLVNAAPLPHPGDGEEVLAFVTYGPVKLANLRRRPQITATFRRGWNFASVEGTAELAGPNDPAAWLDRAEGLRLLLRGIFQAAGGTHDDWDDYDRVMAAQGRTAVLIHPTRIYGNA